MSWRGKGEFRREDMPSRLRRFSPDEAVHRLTDIDVDTLATEGKSLILIDVDNTLLPWRSEEISDETKAWVDRAKEDGFDLCILSNTRNKERLARIAKILDIPFILDKFKPSTRMYEMALEKFKKEPTDAVMIGDQLLTDVLGANRAGIDAIWVERMASKEFPGTRFLSRNVERLLGVFLYRYFQHPEDEPAPIREGFFQRKVVRQFAKFLVVGGTSFIIDYCVRMTLMYGIPVDGKPLGEVGGQWVINSTGYGQGGQPEDAFVPVAAFVAACLAIVNSFIWNRRWTWRIRGAEDRKAQFAKFATVSLIGMVINVVLTTVFYTIIPGDKAALRIATVLAAGCVAVWNFVGQRVYAFRTALKD